MPLDSDAPRGNHFAPSNASAAGNTTPDSSTSVPAVHNTSTPAARSASPDDTSMFMAAASSRSGAGQSARDASTGASQTARAERGASTAQPAHAEHDRAGSARTSAQQRPQKDNLQDWAYDPVDFSMSQGEGHGGSSTYRKRKRRKRGASNGKKAAIVVGILALVLALIGGVSGFMLYRDASGMLSESRELMSVAETLKTNFEEGDSDGLKSTAADIAQRVSAMKQTTESPLWTIASFFPVYGEDVQFVRGMLAQADNLVQNALLPASDNLAEFQPSNLFHDGTVDLDLLSTFIGTLDTVEPVLTESSEAMKALPEPHIGKLVELSDKIEEPMVSAIDALRQVNELAPLLPQMLGADGSRTYLITAENNAEIRTLGGFAGALGVMTVDNGSISLGEFEGTLTMGTEGPTDAITITDEEMTLFQPYEPTMNYTSGDSYFTPDFPRGAQLASTLWSVKHDGQHIDGVIALDPIFLQYLLQLTGSVTAIDGMEVDGSNAAEALLSSTYWNYPTDGKMQDAVFASVAAGAFDKLLGNLGEVGFTKLFAVLGRGASEGRLLMWMAQEDEQAAVEELGVDGALPADASDPQTGLYVNNYSYSKLDWYLNIDTQMGEGVKQADGSTVYTMSATLTNEMSAEEAADLPAYVQAHNGGADDPSQEMLRLYLYAPMGGSITDVSSSYGSMSEATHNGLQVMYQDIRMLPGESVTVTYTVVVPAEAEGELELRVTPTAQYARKGTAGDATQPGSVQGQTAAN